MEKGVDRSLQKETKQIGHPKVMIGVIGSAVSRSAQLRIKARIIGAEIAHTNCTLATGGGAGLPYESVLAAMESGGPTIGISPAASESEHKSKYHFPTENFDNLIYTGFGLKGRNVVLVRSCACLIMISGRMGTLNEFTIAYDEGKAIGVLTQTGGIADMSRQILRVAQKRGGHVLFNDDPKEIVRMTLRRTLRASAKSSPIP